MNITQLHQLNTLCDAVLLARGDYVRKLTGARVGDLMRHTHTTSRVAGEVKTARNSLKFRDKEIKRLTSERKAKAKSFKDAITGEAQGGITVQDAAEDPEYAARIMARGKQQTLDKLYKRGIWER